MATQIAGSFGPTIDTDPGRDLFRRRGEPVAFVSGGAYVVTGGPSAACAAGLLSGTTLIALTHGSTASTSVYVTQINFTINASVTGSAGNTPGELLWQRFGGAVPTGGTARTPARKDPSQGSPTQVASVSDSATGLTTGSLAFTSSFVTHAIGNFGAGAFGSVTYLTPLAEDEFIRLAAGDGLALSISSTAPPQLTWTFTYAIHYFEQ